MSKVTTMDFVTVPLLVSDLEHCSALKMVISMVAKKVVGMVS